MPAVLLHVLLPPVASGGPVLFTAGVRPSTEPPKSKAQAAGRDYCHADTCQVRSQRLH